MIKKQEMNYCKKLKMALKSGQILSLEVVPQESLMIWVQESIFRMGLHSFTSVEKMIDLDKFLV
jgi:hypothetical protein